VTRHICPGGILFPISQITFPWFIMEKLSAAAAAKSYPEDEVWSSCYSFWNWTARRIFKSKLVNNVLTWCNKNWFILPMLLFKTFTWMKMLSILISVQYLYSYYLSLHINPHHFISFFSFVLSSSSGLLLTIQKFNVNLDEKSPGLQAIFFQPFTFPLYSLLMNSVFRFLSRVWYLCHSRDVLCFFPPLLPADKNPWAFFLSRF